MNVVSTDESSNCCIVGFVQINLTMIRELIPSSYLTGLSEKDGPYVR
jgi:hypothetical protein